MYNRYIPGADGVFHRTVVDDRPQPPPVPPAAFVAEPVLGPKEEIPAPGGEIPCAGTQKPPEGSGHFLRKLLPREIDLGDVLALLIVLVLLMDSEQDDMLTVLVTVAAFLLL